MCVPDNAVWYRLEFDSEHPKKFKHSWKIFQSWLCRLDEISAIRQGVFIVGTIYKNTSFELAFYVEQTDEGNRVPKSDETDAVNHSRARSMSDVLASKFPNKIKVFQNDDLQIKALRNVCVFLSQLDANFHDT